MSVAWKQFHLAVYRLAGSEPQSERLANAVTMHLSRLTEKDVPSEIRPQFVEFLSRVRDLRTVPPDVATPQQENEPGIQENIRSIVSMYDALIRYQPIRRRCVQE
ncbi:MAG: hypothetical protein JWR21_1877 [Herminiimonas sp.]|nr:hypothetical protein [Herminiimonas sp.]